MLLGTLDLWRQFANLEKEEFSNHRAIMRLTHVNWQVAEGKQRQYLDGCYVAKLGLIVRNLYISLI